MVTIELSDAEAAAVVDSLDWLLSETRMEISNTENADFRARLKDEKAALQHLLEQVRASAPVEPTAQI